MEHDKLMYDLLKEVRDEQKKLVEKSNEHKEETMKWQNFASSRLTNIEVDLREHKEGVIQNRTAIQMFSERLETLEQPGKVKAFMYDHGMKTFKFITAAGAAMAILGKYLNWF